MNAALACTGLVLLVALADKASADEVSYSAALTPGEAPWERTVSFPGFDPSLGTLENVRLEVSSKTNGMAGIENLARASAQGELEFSAAVEIDAVGVTLTVRPRVQAVYALAGFDGEQDFDGSSGVRLRSLGADAVGERSLPIQVFIGAGSVEFTVNAENTSQSLGDATDIALGTRVRARAEIRLTYDFLPFPDCDGDGVPDVLENDCDEDGVPDDCEPDCDENGVPDDCEPDSDGDGLPDACDAPEVCGYDRPGSLLVFPEFDNRTGRTTIVSVTNTDLLPSPEGILLRFVYIRSTGCVFFDRRDALTPGDTLTFLSTAHMPAIQDDRGYLYVYAEDPNTLEAVAHDFLIGAATHSDAFTMFNYGYSAMAYESPQPRGFPTDLNGNGARDLDGLEYVPAPNRVLVPRFLATVGTFNSDLILLGLSSELDASFTTDLFVFNDNEEVFSVTTLHGCWARTPLAALSVIFSNGFLQSTTQDPLEILGAPNVESGWCRFHGRVAVTDDGFLQIDPAVIGMLVEGAAGTRSSSLPFWEGVRNVGSLFSLDG